MAIVFGVVLIVRGGDEIDTDVRKHVDACSTTESKMTYLCSLITENGNSSDAANLRKSSAIRLLGKTGGTNAISTLVTNLTFMDRRYNGSPASRALVDIGEAAVPELLKVVEGSTDELKIQWAALTVGVIKGGTWKEFLEQQKGILPRKAFDRLTHYAIIIN